MQLCNPAVPNLWLRPPPKSHKINLRGCEVMNGRGKEKKNDISHTQLCIYLSDISLMVASFVKNVLILPHWKSNNLRAVGNTPTISPSYDPAFKNPDCPFKFMYSNVLHTV